MTRRGYIQSVTINAGKITNSAENDDGVVEEALGLEKARDICYPLRR